MGKIFLKFSLNYKRLQDELIPINTWEKSKNVFLKQSNYPKLIVPIEQLLKNYRKTLDSLFLAVNQRIQTGENSHVKIKPMGESYHWFLPYQKREELANNPFFIQLPQFSIVDILYFVDTHCHFLKKFTPIQPHSIKNKRHDSLLLAAILANAIRVGTYKMADSASLNYEELSYVEKTYLRLETLHDAIDCINEATSQLTVFQQWYIQDVLHSSLDGSKIGTRFPTLKSRYSPKYFGLHKGVVSYNMITNHLPVNAKIIGANEHESHFLFDLIFNNTASVKPTRHSGDGHSINHLNFTFLDFIDHQFMPHFPRIHEKPLYCFGNVKQYNHCIIKPHRKIREKLIIEEWPAIQHIFVSTLQGEANQSIIIKKLSSHDYHSKTKEALWEYDNILKSLYILNYIDDICLRQAVRRAMNRGEAYHQLCRAIAYMSGGRLRGHTELELDIWNDCARLIASTIIYYNTAILSTLFEQAQNDKQRDFIKQLSPVAWHHIHLLGRYEFNRDPLKLNIKQLVKNLKLNC